MVQHGIRLVAPSSLPRKPALSAVLSRWARILIRTPEGAQGLRTLYGSLGRGGYEGIHPDNWGNILIIEDVGGTVTARITGKKSEFVRLPFRSHLSGRPDSRQIAGAPSLDRRQPGRVRAGGRQHPTGDTLSENQLLLHTVGASWPVQWVTVHDTDVDGTDAVRCQRPG